MWVRVAIPRPLDGLFTYAVPPQCVDAVFPGSVVSVSFGRSKTHAFVIEVISDRSTIEKDGIPFEKIRSFDEVLETEGADSQMMRVCQFASEYYFAPLGEVLDCALPRSVLGLKAKRGRNSDSILEAKPKKNVSLNEEQERAFEAVMATSKPFLLDGITGSGKTEVYLEVAQKVLAEGKSVLCLVPEIALTDQLKNRFEERLGLPVALWHSALSDGKRRDLFLAIKTGAIRVVVGARSAVFAPLDQLGLVIVDEEHDVTYKQEDRVRYNARDLAIFRAHCARAKVILGSATPSLESRENVRSQKFETFQLRSRALGSVLPRVELFDLKEAEPIEGVQAPFHPEVLERMTQTLSQGEQVLVYLNRRGFAAFVLCEDCGHVEECTECSVSMTFHLRPRELRCHICGKSQPVHDQCPSCQGFNLKPKGAGTESLEEELPKIFPEIRGARLDRDQVTSQKKLEEILDDFRNQKTNTLFGTQMLVKGHDFENVTLVVVVMADALFRWPDFRSAERAVQTLLQVSGRAGRREKQGSVLIQTYDPEHPVLQVLTGEQTLEDFMDFERDLREGLNYPPFVRMARIRIEDASPEGALSWATEVSKNLRHPKFSATMPSGEAIEVLGPSPSMIQKKKGVFRVDLLIKARDWALMQRTLRQIRQFLTQKEVEHIIDVDPYTLD